MLFSLSLLMSDKCMHPECIISELITFYCLVFWMITYYMGCAGYGGFQCHLEKESLPYICKLWSEQFI